MLENNIVTYKVTGKQALFTDPKTKVGGEKFSYPIPTYEALKGLTKSIYWKPVFIWYIDKVRILKPIQRVSRNIKNRVYGGGVDLSIYTYLQDVEYQVQARFEWKEYRSDLKDDRNPAKHREMMERFISKGGRYDTFLGNRECQSYVEECEFGEGQGYYDFIAEQPFDLMFHSFLYPDESGESGLYSQFWKPVMKNGVIEFPRPEECNPAHKKFIREMEPFIPEKRGEG